MRVFLSLFIALAAGNASAQSLSLSPAVVQLKGTLGQSSTQTLTLPNGMKVPMAFDLVAQDVVIRDNKRVYVDAGAEADSMAATAVFVPPSVTVPAGGSKSVTVTITARPLPTARWSRSSAAGPGSPTAAREPSAPSAR
jgi:hypothetical protein